MIVVSRSARAHRFGAMMAMIAAGTLDPFELLGKEIAADEAPAALAFVEIVRIFRRLIEGPWAVCQNSLGGGRAGPVFDGESTRHEALSTVD